jgi:phage tail sheath protein FI
MPEYLSPGVYVEEIDAGPKPIAPVATSTAGAVGVTQRGPETPTLVTNYGDYVRTFGGPVPAPDDDGAWEAVGHYWHMAESIKGFFDEGGARVYVQRVAPKGAGASHVDFNGGLHAGLKRDVAPADETIQLTHVLGLTPGAKLDLVTEEGAPIGPVTVDSIDYDTRTAKLTGAAGVSARRGHDLARILAVDATQAVLTATATSKGAWGDDVSVEIMPVVGARKTLGATPTAGTAVNTKTTADADEKATELTVTAVPGAIDKSNKNLAIQVNGGATIMVTAVTDAPPVPGSPPAVKLALASPLGAVVAAGGIVSVRRSAVAGAVVTVVGADRLYPDALVALEGAAGAQVLTVVSIAGSQVTLSDTPAKAYLEGESINVVEADVSVRCDPAGVREESELFTAMRLTNTADPASLVAGVNLRSRLVRLTAGTNYDGTRLETFPAVTSGARAALAGGSDAFGSLLPADFVGVDNGPGDRSGIQALEEIDQVAICVVPGMWDADVRNALIVHCETLGDRFAILDPPPGLDVQKVEEFRSPIDTKYAALYYPWVEIRDPRPTGGVQQAPPSGFVAGVYARTDAARGVHKAPANETLRSIRGLEQAITKREQDILNPQSINVLRAFPGRGNRIWGARVLTSDAAWKYVPVRRLFLMIEESIDEGTQWVVFEPNDEPLWARVRQTVTRFLASQWRIGALQGATADEAFFVTCDRSTMTQDDIDNGRLICVVGIAPVKPTEFVIFRIQQKTLELATD